MLLAWSTSKYHIKKVWEHDLYFHRYKDMVCRWLSECGFVTHLRADGQVRQEFMQDRC
jgi:hypothetical protein